MSSLHVPTEIVNEIGKHTGNDPSTRLSSRGVATTWSRQSIDDLLLIIKLGSWAGIRNFIDMISTPLCTFPQPIRNRKLILNGLAAMDDEAGSTLQDLMSSITPTESLAIQVITGGIAGILNTVSQGWNHISQLSLSGGIHPPTAFFAALEAFPQLTALCLQEIRMEGLESAGQGESVVQFRFPAVKLSLVLSACLWGFLRVHVLPGRGLANVEELDIQERFCFAEEGVSEMMKGLRELVGVPVLRLRAIYEASAFSDLRDITRDLKNIFQGRHLCLAKIHGLRRLHIYFNEIPANIALNSLIIHTIYLPSTDVGLAIEFHVPSSPDLWDNADPSGQIRQLLQDTQSNTTAVVTASLAVRGFPGTLPAAVQASRTAMVCGYPVVFMDDEE